MKSVGAGKGPQYRPVDRKKYEEAWLHFTVACPGCGWNCLRSADGFHRCSKCNKTWEEGMPTCPKRK